MVPRRYESADKDAAPLGKPLQFSFSSKTAQNRFLKGAMTERVSSWDPTDLKARGIPSKNLVNIYRRWGEGEYGVILSGNIMIEYDHLEAAGNPIITQENGFSGERFDAFKELATEAKKHGSLIVGQVSHPGRQVPSFIQQHPVSASDIQLEGNVMGMTFSQPRAATESDLKHIINGFAHAAEYLDKAGYDGIELHGAHGYLLSQFLSPSTNKRSDNYGGSLENRARILTEIASETRARTSKDFILSIKLNSVEFQESGLDTKEAATLCQILEQSTFDFVELSGGTYESLAFEHKRDSTRKREAFFLEFAEQITPGLKKTRTYITGGLKTVGAMVDALNSVDGVGLARPTTQEPTLPKLILQGKVKGAINQLTDDNNFGMTNVAAGTQIRQIGKDQQPIDLSDEKNFEAFQKDMETWSAGLKDNKDGKKYGFIDIESMPGVPYGSAAPKLA